MFSIGAHSYVNEYNMDSSVCHCHTHTHTPYVLSVLPTSIPIDLLSTVHITHMLKIKSTGSYYI